MRDVGGWLQSEEKGKELVLQRGLGGQGAQGIGCPGGLCTAAVVASSITNQQRGPTDREKAGERTGDRVGVVLRAMVWSCQRGKPPLPAVSSQPGQSWLGSLHKTKDISFSCYPSS